MLSNKWISIKVCLLISLLSSFVLEQVWAEEVSCTTVCSNNFKECERKVDITKTAETRGQPHGAMAYGYSAAFQQNLNNNEIEKHSIEGYRKCEDANLNCLGGCSSSAPRVNSVIFRKPQSEISYP